MHTFVNFPLTNSKLATAFIKQNIVEAFPNKVWNFEDDTTSKGRSRNAKTLKKIIDHFMWMHPRGKGTKGSPFLREYYAACHTIKGLQSDPRPSYRRNQEPVKKLLATERARNGDALMMFEPDAWLVSADRRGIPTKTINALVERNLVTGLFDGSGKAIMLALTDNGVRAHMSVKAARETLGRQAAINAITDGATGQADDMFFAMIDIGKTAGAITIRQDSQDDALRLRNTIVEMLKAEKVGG